MTIRTGEMLLRCQMSMYSSHFRKWRIDDILSKRKILVPRPMLNRVWVYTGYHYQGQVPWETNFRLHHACYAGRRQDE